MVEPQFSHFVPIKSLVRSILTRGHCSTSHHLGLEWRLCPAWVQAEYSTIGAHDVFAARLSLQYLLATRSYS